MTAKTFPHLLLKVSLFQYLLSL